MGWRLGLLWFKFGSFEKIGVKLAFFQSEDTSPELRYFLKIICSAVAVCSGSTWSPWSNLAVILSTPGAEVDFNLLSFLTIASFLISISSMIKIFFYFLKCKWWFISITLLEKKLFSSLATLSSSVSLLPASSFLLVANWRPSFCFGFYIGVELLIVCSLSSFRQLPFKLPPI